MKGGGGGSGGGSGGGGGVLNFRKRHSHKMIKFLLIACFHRTKNYQGISLFLNSVSNIWYTILYYIYSIYTPIISHEEVYKQCVNT